jgi:hypothetical protein
MMTSHEDPNTPAPPPDLADPPCPHYRHVADAEAAGWTRPDRNRGDVEIVPPGRLPTGDVDHERWERHGEPSTPVLIWTPLGWVAYQMFPPGLHPRG